MPARILQVDDSLKVALDSRADLGAIGPRISQPEHTNTVTGSIRIPIWQGGRAAGDMEQAEASLEQRRAEAADLRGKVEADVRNGFLDLQAAGSRVGLAANNQELAKETLRLAQEKFDAGVSDSVEVTQAAEAVATADLDRITALFVHNLAKLSLARALGQAEMRLGGFLPDEYGGKLMAVRLEWCSVVVRCFPLLFGRPRCNCKYDEAPAR
jgi:outer membrane protein TolC